jgi:hypothetical protein
VAEPSCGGAEPGRGNTIQVFIYHTASFWWYVAIEKKRKEYKRKIQTVETR